MKKSEVQRHTDHGYGCPYPAVNVKVHRLGVTTQDVVDRFGCTEAQAEKALEFAFEAACQQFWEYWQDTTGCCENGLSGSPEYAYFPGYKPVAYSVGHSGGWLIVQGLPPVEDWDAIMLRGWAKFQRHVLEDVKYRIGKDTMLEDIEANEWYKEHADQYNFYQGKGKQSVCIADVKADLIAYATEKYGFVPTLP
jgi:hypothetical protein